MTTETSAPHTPIDIAPEPVASVVELIDAIEEVVTSGRRVPFSANVVVNEDETLELIDRARLGLPQEVVQARHTLDERERILEAAEQEAQSVLERAQEDAHAILEEAGKRAATLVADHEILRLASEQAQSGLAEAQELAATTRRESEAYAREVMEELDGHLARALTTVRKGIESLPKGTEGARGRRHR